MKKQILMSLILVGSVSSAFAQEATEDQSANSSTIKMSDVQKKDEKVKDIDDEITNAKMRAESGSKSQWSISADLTYGGGNLEAPFSGVRPNYSGEVSTNDVTYLTGSIAGSYRVDKNNRINLGTGVEMLTPFQATAEEMTTSTENGGNSEVATPYISWKWAGKIGSTQNALGATYSHSTSNYDLNQKHVSGAVGASHTVIFNIEGSNFQPGLMTAFEQQIFTQGNPRTYDYQFGFYPFAEYEMNDTFSLRTVFRPFTFSHLSTADSTTYVRSMYTQSVGLGIAVTRDIYVYPNMQFAPENLKPELTNVGLSTSLNIF